MSSKSTLYLLFNHRLTEEQKVDAQKSLGIEKIVYLPDSLLEIWKNIPPEIESLKTLLNPVMEYLDERCLDGDYLLVQGDFGATYIMIDEAMKRNIIPLYATTKREATEKMYEGKSIKESIFTHVRFRRYGV